MDDNRQQMIAQIKALKELQRRRAKRTFHDFLQYVDPKGAGARNRPASTKTKC